MTFTKLAYISTKSFENIISSLEECGYSDCYSEHIDSCNSAELWVELEDKGIMDVLVNYGFISANESEEIFSNCTDTILFY